MKDKEHGGLDKGANENGDDKGDELDREGVEEAVDSDEDLGDDEEADAGDEALGSDVDQRSKPDAHDGTLV
jgi:hypothetical protein